MMVDFVRSLARRAPKAVRALRGLAHPLHEVAVLRDLRRTRGEVAFLRDAQTSRDGRGRTVLVVALDEPVYGAKLLLMLASSLRLRGWRVVVLGGSRGAGWVAPYARAFGVKEVLYLDEVGLEAGDEALVSSTLNEFMSTHLTFGDVKQWTFRGSWIGPQVLSTVSRNQLAGAPDPAEPETRRQLKELLPRTLEYVLRAERLVAALRPTLGITIEANYARYGAVVDVLIGAGADVVQATQPWRDDALMCRRLTPATRREHPSSLSLEVLDRLERRPWTRGHERELDEQFAARYGGEWFLQKRNQRRTRAYDRHQLADRFDLDPSKRIAVVFSHVLWDANLFYGEDLFEDYGHWFAETVRAAADNTNVNWIVKLHPANAWKRAQLGLDGEYSELALIRRAVGSLPQHVRLLYPETDVSTLSLYEAGDVGVTVRGTPGMEMPCFGKPVVTAGTGRYAGLGFTIDPATRDDYLDVLAHVQGIGPLDMERTRRARRHAHAVFGRRHWRMLSFRSTFTRGGGPLDHNLSPAVSSLDDVRRNGDLDRFATWAVETEEVDYLDG